MKNLKVMADGKKGFSWEFLGLLIYEVIAFIGWIFFVAAMCLLMLDSLPVRQ